MIFFSFFFQKIFSPTIPSGRRVKKDLSSEAESVKAEKWTAEKKRPNIKKDGRRVKKEIIQSSSVFSLGPAGKSSQGTLLHWSRFYGDIHRTLFLA